MRTSAAVLILLLVVAIVLLAADLRRQCRRAGRRDGYLIAPYLDLDELGERGDYYALTQCP
jgi:hypothetical protein